MLTQLLPLIFYFVVNFMTSLADPFLRELPDFGYGVPDRKPYEVGKASTYGRPAKKCAPEDKKCKPRKAGSRKQSLMACAPLVRVGPGMHTCAHREHVCGTILLLEHTVTKKTTLCRVMDRGPYGAYDAETGEWFNKAREPHRAGEYRGILDMSPATRAALAPGDGGLPTVRTWVVYKPRKPLKVTAPLHREHPQRTREPGV